MVGVGASRGVPAAEVLELVMDTLALAGCSPGSVGALATVAAKAGEPGLTGAARALGVPLRSFPAEVLATVRVPDPSAAARDAVGTPSVAEAAALLAAGPGAELVVGKRKSAPQGRPAGATCAVAAATGPENAAMPGSTRGAVAARADAADIVMTSPHSAPHRPPPTGPVPDSETPGNEEML
ncbi:cobalamin biosynthesis protein [Streptomyces piniterrae]|uniref:Cobalamin biosynthesis protein n=1 Tax=Streptomyces piniterrae TaxID=2571125 RepID=A0A4U0NBD4_9ACTN|nr:cobalamin biosynthesis protein [Streptomyces piniterrae]